MPDVIGLVPAAGLATRLGPLPCSKEILPIGMVDSEGARPKVISEYLLESFRLAGASRVFFIIRRGKWDIPNFFGDGQRFGLSLGYLMMGPSHGAPFTLDQAYPFVGDATVLLGFPDVVFRPADAYRTVLDRLSRTGADVVLGVFPTTNPEKMDRTVTEPGGRVVRIEVKPKHSREKTTWLIAAWSRRFTEFLHAYIQERLAEGISSEEPVEAYVGTVFQSAIEHGLVIDSVDFPGGACLDIGTPDDMRRSLRLAEAGDLREGL